MLCPTCGATARDGAAHCPACGAGLAAAPTGPLSVQTAALPAAPISRPATARLPGRAFAAGLLAGLLGLPLLALLVLALVGGGAPRRSAAAPPGQPDLSVRLSRAYLERSLANNEQFHNPVIELGRHPLGGAALTLTVGLEFPLVGVRNVQTRSQVRAENNELIVATEQAGLGAEGQLPIPGGLVERVISDMINSEIAKRLQSNPSIEVDIVHVDASAEALQVDAAIRQKR
ncbi:MAG TPA: zinc ribbon domain-containing protein [Herpetosiphonaceae bacterium]|nr:zinc ribbon domain-containing protein [Herpetosiphonaceae bacterium]